MARQAVAPVVQFSTGVPGGVGTTGVAALEIINSSASKNVFIKEILASLTAATATRLGVGRPAAAGITPTTPILFQGLDGVSVADAKTAIAWATPPTIPAKFYADIFQQNVAGLTIDFVFADDGIMLKPGQTLVVWNLAGNSVCNFTIDASEDVTVRVNN
jgi:hypothetical protein